jgi:hypothetical protein
MLASQKDAITKITGIITPESIDELENKLGGAFTILKSKHFDQEERYGHLAIVIPEAKYRVVIANPTWVYAAPADPGAYAAAALAAGVLAAQRYQTSHSTRSKSGPMPTKLGPKRRARNYSYMG